MQPEIFRAPAPQPKLKLLFGQNLILKTSRSRLEQEGYGEGWSGCGREQAEAQADKGDGLVHPGAEERVVESLG